MKLRMLVVIGCFLATITVAMAAPAYQGETILVWQANSPVVDGIIGADEWTDKHKIGDYKDLNFVYWGEDIWKSPNDLSRTDYAGVKDNCLFWTSVLKGQGLSNTNAQQYIHTSDHSLLAIANTAGIGHMFFFAPRANNFCAYYQTGADPAYKPLPNGMQIASKVESDQCTFEAKIPLASIGMTCQEGEVFRLNLIAYKKSNDRFIVVGADPKGFNAYYSTANWSTAKWAKPSDSKVLVDFPRTIHLPKTIGEHITFGHVRKLKNGTYIELQNPTITLVARNEHCFYVVSENNEVGWKVIPPFGFDLNTLKSNQIVDSISGVVSDCQLMADTIVVNLRYDSDGNPYDRAFPPPQPVYIPTAKLGGGVSEGFSQAYGYGIGLSNVYLRVCSTGLVIRDHDTDGYFEIGNGQTKTKVYTDLQTTQWPPVTVTNPIDPGDPWGEWVTTPATARIVGISVQSKDDPTKAAIQAGDLSFTVFPEQIYGGQQ